MVNTTKNNTRLIDLKNLPFHQVLPLIVDLPDFQFWRVVDWLARP